jgi:pentapeptide MXKDX repeat protein
MKPLEAIALAAILATGTGAWATDAPRKPMKMDEPMHGEMKKRSMKKGDVKKAAEKKDREIKPILEREAAGSAKK